MSVLIGLIGMNPDEVEALAVQLETGAAELQDLMARLGRALSATTWSGADRQQFESAWTGELAPAMQSMVAALQEAGGIARGNAEQQRNASA